MKLKKILAGVLASAMTLTAEFVPAIVNETAPLFQSAITASAAEYSNIGELFESAEDVRNCEFLDGTNDENYMIMKGRKYYQGIKMTMGWNDPGEITFNVENINNISFDFGRIDNTEYYEATLSISKDGGELKELVKIDAGDGWNKQSIDVSKLSKIKISVLSGNGAQYGLGDFTVDDMPVAIPHTVPYFKTSEDFIKSGDFRNCEVYDGSEPEDKDEEIKTMMFKGRTYYQGIKMTTGWNDPAHVNFNVENVNKVSLDFCRIDNTNQADTTLQVILDGELSAEYKMNYSDFLKEITVDVSEASTLRLACDGDVVCGLGNVTIDDLPVVKPCEVPVYENIGDFQKAAIDCRNIELFDGTNKKEYMNLKGRKYYQGIQMGAGFANPGEITLNVENVNKLSFDLCRISGTQGLDVDIHVYRNGEWWQDIKVKSTDLWEEISLDVHKIDIIKFSMSVEFGQGVVYGLGNLTIDDMPVKMNYDTPVYENEIDFINSSIESDFIAFDGSNTFKNIVIGGKEYCQGIQLDGGNKNIESNVENVDSITFTLGRVDDSWENDICLDIYKDGEFWYQLKQPAKQAATQYKLNLTDTSVLKIVNNSGTNCGLMYFAINDDYSNFTNDTYDFTEEVYTDPSKINIICVHNYEGNKCTLCGLVCEHKFEKSVCTVCGFKCTHEYDEGVCKVCGHECTHTFEDGVCKFCELKCRHIYEGSKCKVCGVVCEHEAYKYGYCEECGIECAHEYNKNGKCAVCGMNIRGDISDNGKIDLYDAIEIAKSLIGKRKFTEEERITADFNKDGKVDLHDAIEIAKYILKK